MSRSLGTQSPATILAASAEQARIHTMVSLFKHVGYGGWFGTAMAGAALRTGRRRHRPAGG